MSLYTDQMHLKRVLRGEASPRWTPLAAKALTIIDPLFVPGMGAVSARGSDGKLRCPVLGCGQFFHRLGTHISRSHREVGGVGAVLAALDIPESVSLISEAAKQSYRRAYLEHGPRTKAGLSHGRSAWRRRKTGRRAGQVRTRQTLCQRNMNDTCNAQIAGRISDLREKLGRTPVLREYEVEYGATEVSAMYRVYFSWENALATCGYKSRFSRKQTEVSDVLPGLKSWYDAHGDLPSTLEIQRNRAAPLLPSYATILKAFKTDNWYGAMRMAASLLNIYGGRYGLPEDCRPKEEVAA